MATLHTTAGETDTTIRETPGVCGGYPRIGRTRIAVRLVVEQYRDTGSVDGVRAIYPQLATAQVESALAYYRDYPARVDEDITRHAQLLGLAFSENRSTI